jgi:cytochrome b561
MDHQKSRIIEKNVGYTLLAIGLILIILPALLALSIFFTGATVPQMVPKPTSEQGELARAAADFSNVCLIFFIFIILIWAGSTVSSRGVTMVKDVRLKLARKSLREVADTIKKVEDENL